MPPRTPKACRIQGCRGTSTEKHGYCDTHKGKTNTWNTNKHKEKRTRGRAGQTLRKSILKRDMGLCVMCTSMGLTRPAEEVDHIVSLANGGTDAASNLRSLCKPCHKVKTKIELWPHLVPYLPEFKTKVVVVCGPPACGKTHYINEHKQPGDVVLDIDDILQAQGITRLNRTEKQIEIALTERNVRLYTLCNKNTGTIWLPTTASHPTTRKLWKERTGGEVVLLRVCPSVCIERIQSDPTRPATQAQIARDYLYD